MRNFFNFIKEIIIFLDGLWIDNVGQEVIFTDVEPSVKLYGFYEWTNQSPMTVQFGMDTIINNLGTDLVGHKVLIEGYDWQITEVDYVRDKILGKYRISLECAAYQDEPNINIYKPDDMEI